LSVPSVPLARGTCIHRSTLINRHTCANEKGASGEFIATRAARIKLLLRTDLEVELKREFYDSSTVLVGDFTEVVKRIASIASTTISVTEATSWIADIVNGPTISIWIAILSYVADRIKRKEEVGSAPIQRSYVDLSRIGLVEDIEEPGAELELLRLAEIEVLEERGDEVAPAWCSQIERRL